MKVLEESKLVRKGIKVWFFWETNHWQHGNVKALDRNGVPADNPCSTIQTLETRLPPRSTWVHLHGSGENIWQKKAMSLLQFWMREVGQLSTMFVRHARDQEQEWKKAGADSWQLVVSLPFICSKTTRWSFKFQFPGQIKKKLFEALPPGIILPCLLIT